MKPIKVGIYFNGKFGCSRYKDLIPVLNSVPDVFAEEFTPFVPYDILIIQESALDGSGEKLFSPNKDARWILDSDVKLHQRNLKFSTHCDLITSKVFSETKNLNKLLRRDSHMLSDAVAYRSGRPFKKELRSLVWYGKSEDMVELESLNARVLGNLKGQCDLKIISDSHSEYLRVSRKLDISTDYREYSYANFSADLENNDMVVLPPTESSDALLRYLEAAVRGMPILWGQCETYDTIYNHLMQSVTDPGHLEILAALRPASKPPEYLDQFDLYGLGLQPAKDFIKKSRTFVVETNLIQNRAEAWLEFMMGVLRA